MCVYMSIEYECLLYMCVMHIHCVCVFVYPCTNAEDKGEGWVPFSSILHCISSETEPPTELGVHSAGDTGVWHNLNIFMGTGI